MSVPSQNCAYSESIEVKIKVKQHDTIRLMLPIKGSNWKRCTWSSERSYERNLEEINHN